MARKPNYDFEKRKKEQDRKAKKDAKRADRQARRDEARLSGEDVDLADGADLADLGVGAPQGEGDGRDDQGDGAEDGPPRT